MNELFYISLLAIIAMIFGYTFHWSQRTLKLEKKNGHEQEQINQLKTQVKDLEKENKQLHQEIGELKEQLERYEQKK